MIPRGCRSSQFPACPTLETSSHHFLLSKYIWEKENAIVVQANSIVALDLDSGDINWAVQLGPLESWTYACIGAAANSPQLNLSAIDIYLSV